MTPGRVAGVFNLEISIFGSILKYMYDADKKQQILHELSEQLGNISAACMVCGIDRTSYYRWIKEDAKFAKKADEAIESGKARFVDLAEHGLAHNVKQKDQRAIEYTLNCQGKARGWGKRDFTGMIGGENVQVNIIQPDPPEEVDWDEVERERLEMEQSDEN
jgi:transposase-like protein